MISFSGVFMLKFYSLVSLLWLSISAFAHSSSAVGFKEIDLVLQS
ncbi:hypothetical protein; putative exported protein [Xenorhabdus bovienii SS-2004]|uniref:Uncharacterized protein n=1 Tax=Xenorhabdus bovienii (strain SS-2004) TaxID=406818 RepID=D3UWY8_XENBS|nr:hypothetical protein; putative exported protein [Xenorhabdus bovienii SS-2004]